MPTLDKTDALDTDATTTKLKVGLGWDPANGQKKGMLGRVKKARGTDLDLLGIAFSKGDPKRYAGFDDLDPLKDGSFVSLGDNVTGAGEGDDEQIVANLPGISDIWDEFVFVACAFKKGTTFEQAKNVEMNVYDLSEGPEQKVGTYLPSLLGGSNAVAVARLKRQPTGFWKMTFLERPGNITQGDMRSVLRFAMEDQGA